MTQPDLSALFDLLPLSRPPLVRGRDVTLYLLRPVKRFPWRELEALGLHTRGWGVSLEDGREKEWHFCFEMDDERLDEGTR